MINSTKAILRSISVLGLITIGLNAQAQWTTSAPNVYLLGGNVGIGTSTPTQALDVVGSLNVSSKIKVGGTNMIGISGSNSTNLGITAGNSNTSTLSTFVGYRAGYVVSTGSYNTMVGANSGRYMTTGTYNTLLGNSAGYNGLTNSYNILIGSSSGYNATSSNNTMVGYQSGYATTSGGYNTYLGYQAGDANTTGTYNTYIGYNADGSATLTNATAIGYNASATASNSLILGNGANVGIGISAPTQKLHVVGSSYITGAFYDSSNDPGGIGEVMSSTATGTDWANVCDLIAGCDMAGLAGWGTDSVSAAVESNQMFAGNEADLVFSSNQLDFLSNPADASRMIYESSTASFRAGYCNDNSWNMGNLGVGSAAFGYNTQASGHYSTALGHATTAPSYGSLAIGRYNVGTVDNIGSGTWIATDPVFEIGIGSTPSARTNAMTVLKNGNVGLGVTPSYKLHVSTNSAAKPGSSSWTVASDERLKTNVEKYTKGLDAVKMIEPVAYNYNGTAGMPTDERFVGTLAQNLEKAAPEMIKDWNYSNGLGEEAVYKVVDYNALQFMMVNAIKELDKKNDALAQRIGDLEKEVREQGRTVVEVLNGASTKVSDGIKADRKITLSPNPTDQRLTVTLEGVDADGSKSVAFDVIDQNGRIVMQLNGNGCNNICKVDINTSGLPVGQYFLLAREGGAVVNTARFTVSR